MCSHLKQRRQIAIFCHSEVGSNTWLGFLPHKHTICHFQLTQHLLFESFTKSFGCICRLLAFRSPCSDAAAWSNLSTFDIFAAHPCLRSPHCWTCRQVGRLWQCLQLDSNRINFKEIVVFFTCLCSRWSSLRPYPTRMSRMVEKAVLLILQSCCHSVQLFLGHTVSETVERRFACWLKSPDFLFSMHMFF